jgi:hypothetical protein
VHSKSDLQNTVRIIRPHHPLFGKTVSLVKIWEHKKKRYYVIELPDKSHTRIYPKVLPPNKFLLSSLSEKFPPSYIPLKIEVQMTQPKGYLFKKDKYRKADGLLQNGGR